MWEYHEKEMNIYYEMIKAVKKGEDKKAYALALQLKDKALPNQKIKDFVEHVIQNYIE